MTEEESLYKFGIVPEPAHLEEIRRELITETRRRREMREGLRDEDYEYESALNLFCVQLYLARQVEDCLLIWRAKQCDFDAFCGIDSYFLCGAGIEKAKAFLGGLGTNEAQEILDQIGALDGSEPTRESTIAWYRRYYGFS